MKHHWGWTVLILVIAFVVGAKYGQGIVAKIPVIGG